MSKEERVLEGKIALVTGAATGIGRGIAELFAKEGAMVIVADINKEKGKQTVEKISGNGGKSFFIPIDVRKWKKGGDCEKVIQEILNCFGRIDILVNNAGAQTGKGFLELSDEEIENITNLNYFGPLKLMRLVVKSMIERKIRGSIINITSVHAKRVRCSPEYTSAKAALNMSNQEAAFELGRYGIRVNCIAPGATDTEMSRKFISGPDREDIATKTPLGRFGKPEDMAQAALFLASDSSSFITGTEIVVDGGLFLRNASVEKSRFPIQE